LTKNSTINGNWKKITGPVDHSSNCERQQINTQHMNGLVNNVWYFFGDLGNWAC